jgi:cytochrome c553
VGDRWGTRRISASIVFAVTAGALSALSTARADDFLIGKAIATQGNASGVTACISCHGAKGEGNGPAGFPRLAGSNALYLSAQLDAFATGQRQNAIMQPIAKLLSANGQNAVATYFSRLASAAPIDVAASQSIEPSDVGAWLATRGRWSQNLPACAQCHGPGGLGVGSSFPPLAGQPASYIATQLHAWKTGGRPPGPMALMPVVASKLSDADISAVAAYYAGQGAVAHDTATKGSK